MNDQTELLRVEWMSLGDQWVATQGQWNDQAAIKFERDCWQQVEHTAKGLLQAMEALDVEMNKAIHRTDC